MQSSPQPLSASVIPAYGTLDSEKFLSPAMREQTIIKERLETHQKRQQLYQEATQKPTQAYRAAVILEEQVDTEHINHPEKKFKALFPVGENAAKGLMYLKEWLPFVESIYCIRAALSSPKADHFDLAYALFRNQCWWRQEMQENPDFAQAYQDLKQSTYQIFAALPSEKFMTSFMKMAEITQALAQTKKPADFPQAQRAFTVTNEASSTKLLHGNALG